MEIAENKQIETNSEDSRSGRRSRSVLHSRPQSTGG